MANDSSIFAKCFEVYGFGDNFLVLAISSSIASGGKSNISLRNLDRFFGEHFDNSFLIGFFGAQLLIFL